MNYKRQQIPLDEDVTAAYEAYADALGTTLPKALAGILTEAVPGVEKMTKALNEIKKTKSNFADDMTVILDQLKEDLHQQRIR